MNIRRIAAIWAAKAAGAGCKLLGRQGVTWAGKIALKIYPPILQELAAEVRKDIFVVCGTNGKTTTNNMLCAALEEEGNKVICNHTGSNMLNGVVAAFALGAGMNRLPLVQKDMLFMSGWRGGVVIMNTMEVLTLLLVIFTALAYIDGHNKRK